MHLRNDIYHIFGGKRLDLPKMNNVEPKYLYLPINTKVKENDVLYICDKITQFFNSIKDE